MDFSDKALVANAVRMVREAVQQLKDLPRQEQRGNPTITNELRVGSTVLWVRVLKSSRTKHEYECIIRLPMCGKAVPERIFAELGVTIEESVEGELRFMLPQKQK